MITLLPDVDFFQQFFETFCYFPWECIFVLFEVSNGVTLSFRSLMSLSFFFAFFWLRDVGLGHNKDKNSDIKRYYCYYRKLRYISRLLVMKSVMPPKFLYILWSIASWELQYLWLLVWLYKTVFSRLRWHTHTHTHTHDTLKLYRYMSKRYK